MNGHIGGHIRAVLFDHDDTLVGTLEAKSLQHKHVAKTLYGKELKDSEIREHWGKPLGTLMGLLYGVDDIDEAMQYTLKIHKNFPKKLFDDTTQTLKKLRQEGKKIGVITATSRFSFEHDLDQIPSLKELLDYTQTQEDTPYHKPDPRVFDPAITWLKEHSIQPHDAIYVGDGLQDMKAALAAGFEFIGVGTGIVTPAQFENSGAKAVKTLNDLVLQ